jgi:cytidine deaminase
VIACASAVSRPSWTQRVHSESQGGENGARKVAFVIEADEAARQMAASGLSEEAFLASLVQPTLPLARPVMSNFRVGAVGLGVSGRIFRGVNLEFPGLPLQQSVHAEQFLITNAMLHGERALKTIAVSAAPCGHCRQFMCELPSSGSLKILIVDKHAEESTLEQLLPHRFGPHDLKEDAFPLLLAERDNRLELEDRGADAITEHLKESALEAANRSYAPYLDCPSGLAIRTAGGKVHNGSYIESAAHNPSMSPLHSALVAAVAEGGEDFADIREAVLVEKKGAQTEHAEIMRISLGKIAPQAKLLVYQVRRKDLRL